MIALGLFAVALVVRVAVGSAFAGPAYPDSYYYVHVAQQLAAGHGFAVDYLWNLDDVAGGVLAAGTLPIPANGYWMPLAELVQVPFTWLLGAGSIAAALPMWLIGAIAAPLTYWIGRDAGIAPSAAVVAGLLAAVPGGLMPFFGQPDSFGLFMTLGALSLWLCARGLRGDRRAFVLGGLVVGFAALTRADGLLLGIPFAFVFARELLRGRERVIGWGAALGCAALFALVMGPWLLRQLDVYGSLSPAAGSGRALWLADYQQLFSITAQPSLGSWLGQGLGPLLASRIGGLFAAVGLFALLPLVVVLAPFAVVGAWVKRRDSAFAPFFAYAIALFAINVLLFAVLVPHGTFIHSAVALLPHTYLLVAAGVAAVVSWVAQRRPVWDAARATTVFGYGAVAVAVAGAVLQSATTIGRWTEHRVAQTALAAGLASAAPGDRVMSADPGAYQYLTGHGGIVTPNDDLATIEDAARLYDVRWLILERNDIVPALVPVMAGDASPSWLSRLVFPNSLTGAVFAVCFDPADARCAS
ncbi:MAG: glycosyltransferase family 39 protein [Chloroflexota bacterium]